MPRPAARRRVAFALQRAWSVALGALALGCAEARTDAPGPADRAADAVLTAGATPFDVSPDGIDCNDPASMQTQASATTCLLANSAPDVVAHNARDNPALHRTMATLAFDTYHDDDVVRASAQAYGFSSSVRVEAFTGPEPHDGLPPYLAYVHKRQYAVDARPRQVALIAFRGTKTVGQDGGGGPAVAAVNVLTDLNGLLEDEASPLGGAKVHKGFAGALGKLQLAGVVAELSAMIDEYDAKPGVYAARPTIYVTGHSLGGAMAQLFAHRLAYYFDHRLDVGGVYTFGAPRLGNGTFREGYAQLQLTERTFSFRYGTDIVTHVAPTSDGRLVGYADELVAGMAQSPLPFTGVLAAFLADKVAVTAALAADYKHVPGKTYWLLHRPGGGYQYRVMLHDDEPKWLDAAYCHFSSKLPLSKLASRLSASATADIDGATIDTAGEHMTYPAALQRTAPDLAAGVEASDDDVEAFLRAHCPCPAEATPSPGAPDGTVCTCPEGQTLTSSTATESGFECRLNGPTCPPGFVRVGSGCQCYAGTSCQPPGAPDGPFDLPPWPPLPGTPPTPGDPPAQPPPPSGPCVPPDAPPAYYDPSTDYYNPGLCRFDRCPAGALRNPTGVTTCACDWSNGSVIVPGTNACQCDASRHFDPNGVSSTVSHCACAPDHVLRDPSNVSLGCWPKPHTYVMKYRKNYESAVTVLSAAGASPTSRSCQ